MKSGATWGKTKFWGRGPMPPP